MTFRRARSLHHLIHLNLSYVTGSMEVRSQEFLPVHPRKSFREIWPDVALGFGLKVQAPVPTVPSWQTAHCIFPPKSLAVLEVEPRTQTHYASVLPETHSQAFYLETGSC